MPSQELINYIKKEQQKGLDKTTIFNSLLTVGWKQSQINEAFKFIFPEETSPSGDQAEQQSRTQIYSKKYPRILSEHRDNKFLLVGAISLTILIILSISATVLFAYDKLPIKNSDLQNKIVNVLMLIPFMSKASK